MIFFISSICCCFLRFIPSGKSIYDPPWFGFILWHLWYNKWTSLKANSPPFINWKLLWYLFLSNSKSFFYSFMCFTINHDFYVECILRSSSLSFLEEIKLIVIVNWIFHVPDFMKSFLVSFMHGLVLLRYFSKSFAITFTFIFNIIVNLKINNSHSFIIIFFLMLKNISNLSNYSIFDCFSFFLV